MGSQPFPPTPGQGDGAAAIRRHEILAADAVFDRMTAIAARTFAVPTALVTLADDGDVWLKASHGLEVVRLEWVAELCAAAALQREPLAIEDARDDGRAFAELLRAAPGGCRFFAAVPLRDRELGGIGTLCILDSEPRRFDAEQVRLLQDLADVLVDEVAARRAADASLGELRRRLSAKEERSREVDHRVMNHLQLVASMLRRQGQASSGRTRRRLAEAAARVSAIAEIHRHLQLDAAGALGGCRGYLDRLCGDLARALGPDVRIELDGDDANATASEMASLGLVVSELVTNAAKQGANRIQVSLHADDGSLRGVSVSDDGGGLPAGFDPEATAGFGLRLVRSLVQGLGGQLRYGSAGDGGGARFSVVLAAH